MSDFFSVQMNMPDSQIVQAEQSANTSAETPENSFNSILKKALPKDNNNTLSNVETSSQDGVSELIIPKETAEKTATSIDNSLLLSSDHDLKANVHQLLAFLTENSKHEKSEQTISNVQSTPDKNEITIPDIQTSQETNGIALPNVQANPDINEIAIPDVQESQETNGIALPNVQANPGINEIAIPDVQESQETKGIVLPNVQANPDINEIAIPDVQESQETKGIVLPNVQAKPDINEATIPSEHIDSDIDTNKLIDFLNTYFTSDSTKDIHETLKDIRTALAQNNAFLSSPSTSSKHDELTFGGLTKNFGELQNLLSGKPATELPITPNSSVSLTLQQQTLLERIQSFIVNGQEAGALSIKSTQTPDQGASLSNRLAQFSSQIEVIDVENNLAETSPLIKTDSFTALEEGLFATTLRSRQPQLSGVRHDSTQQFYDAKTQAQNVMGESTNLSDNQKDDGMKQSGSGFNQTTPLNGSPEWTGIFSMTSSTVLTPLSAQATNPTATTLPSGVIVQDQEVIQQFVERFNVNRRQLDTKIQLKLHPVELGKMEIDLTVKEGSIRANVVAQSQHVQEILERNITKLKSVFEEQGFNVEDITITSSSESVGEFDQFEQQPHRDTSSFLTQNDRSEHHTPFNLDDSEESDNETNSGLNVQA